jgi:hypothetical protein
LKYVAYEPIRRTAPQLAIRPHRDFHFGPQDLDADLLSIARSEPIQGHRLHVPLVQFSVRHRPAVDTGAERASRRKQ